MQQDNSANSKRIAKNTLLLYVRMLFLMAISLYTSRVVLEALGVQDFGIYNVVGGFVWLFAVFSQSLSSAASRFLTFEMGRGDNNRLAHVFSATLIIHIILAVIIFIITESVGLWFVNEKMIIPLDRLNAANWCFQFSILSFVIGLVTVPHNASIIAHEKMSAFAYISIFEGIGKLLICYLIIISPFDKLVVYGFLYMIMTLLIRGMYYYYCKSHFEECHLKLFFDRQLMKEIFGFASWNMIGSSSAVLRNQGGNVLINLFGGPVVNAARAIANQVLNAVNGFVENFMTALKPQITKSYASGDNDYMMTLIYQGSRLSYYMLLVLCLPIIVNTDYILHLWLKTVPEHSVLFVQLTLVFTMIESVSATLITAQQATGKIRNYQIVVGGLQMMNLPVSYVILKLGGIPETILFVSIFFSVGCLCARLYMLRFSISLKVGNFVNKVVLNVIVVSLISSAIPFTLHKILKVSFLNFFTNCLICIICSFIVILYIGCNVRERQFVYSKIKTIVGK